MAYFMSYKISKKEMATVCGLCCSVCNIGTGIICDGPCSVVKGRMKWGLCPIFSCCSKKKLEHCGFCKDFPYCDPMKEIENLEKMLNIPMNNKIRAKNLTRRAEIGTNEWVKEMEEKSKKENLKT